MQTSQRKKKGQLAYKNIHEDNSFVYWRTPKLLKKSNATPKVKTTKLGHIS
jgi:hypothetical protein